jgi:hypothetical protein
VKKSSNKQMGGNRKITKPNNKQMGGQKDNKTK